jgi:tetratricopeptide (TPR) repeat protein
LIFFLRSLWFRRLLGVAFFIVSFGLVFINAETPGEIQAEETQVPLLSKALESKAYEFVLFRGEKFLNRYPSSSYQAPILFLMAQAAAALEQYNEALGDLKKYFLIAPGDLHFVDAKNLQIRVLLESGKPEAALAELSDLKAKRIELETNSDFNLLYGKIRLALGDEAGAKTKLLALSVERKGEGAFVWASYLFKKNRYDEAKEAFTSLLKNEKVSDLLKSQCFFALGKVHFFIKDFEAAEKYFRLYLNGAFLDLDPKGTEEARFLLAYLPYEKKQYSQGVEQLQKLIDDFPDSLFVTQAKYYLARCLELSAQDILAGSKYLDLLDEKITPDLELRIDERLVVFFEGKNESVGFNRFTAKLKTFALTNDQALRLLARAQMKVAPKEAAASFEKLISNDKVAVVDDFLDLSETYRTLGLFEAEASVIKKAMTRFPRSSFLFFRLADGELDASHWKEASVLYQNLLTNQELSADKEQAIDGLGYSLLKMGQYEKSWETYRQGLNDKNFKYRASAMIGMAESSRLLAKWERAKKEYSDFIKNFPDDDQVVPALLFLGKANYDLKVYAEALGVYAQVLEKSSEKKSRREAIYWSAWCYVQMDFPDRAIETFSRLSQEDAALGDMLTLDGLLTCAKLMLNQKRESEGLELLKKISGISFANTDNAEVSNKKNIALQAFLEIGNFYVKREMWNEAELVYQLAAARAQVSPEVMQNAWFALGNGTYAKNEFELAKRYYAFARQVVLGKSSLEENAKLFFWYGLTLKKLKDYETGASQMTSVIDYGTNANPYFWQAHYELADFRLKLGDTNAAKKEWELVQNKADDSGLRNKAGSKLKALMELTMSSSEVTSENNLNEKDSSLSQAAIQENRARVLLEQADLASKTNRQAAVTLYQQVISLSSGKAGSKAYSALIDLLVQNEQWDLVSQEGIAYLYLYPSEILSLEKLYYQLCLAASKSGLKSDGKNWAKRLKKEFPSSKWISQLPPLD